MKKFIIYTDGGAKGNPGPAAIGVVICNEKGELWKKYSLFIGEEKTNNEAEYEAAIFALSKLKQILGKKLAEKTEVEIRTDSEFLFNQMTGKYKILEERIQKLFLKLWNLKLDFKLVDFKLIGREKNKEADKLVKQELKLTE
jgi:ribonuclease HI